jgi:hypothetical protein
MRKTALAFFLGFVVMFALAAMTRPPVEELVEGQHQCGNAVCMGTKTNPVKLQGPTSFETPGTVKAFTPNPDGGPTTLSTADNYVSSSTKALINYDFPGAQASNIALGQPCFDSPTATIANCPFGSQLLLGVDQALATGPGTLTPYLSAANTVFVRECAQMTDAGTFNMPDASYLVRCFP